MAQERKVGTLGVMALLSLPLVSMGFSVVTPAMATLAEHFAGKDVSWICLLYTSSFSYDRWFNETFPRKCRTNQKCGARG